MINHQQLTSVCNILFSAKVHYRLWEELMMRRDQESVDLLNRGYATFFEYTKSAHFKACIIELHKLIETRNDTCNLNSIFQEVERNERQGSDILNTIERYKNETNTTKRGLFIIRNEVEAHCSSNNSSEESFVAASISSQDIHDFITNTATTLNDISYYYFQTKHAFNDISEAESVNLLFEAITSSSGT